MAYGTFINTILFPLELYYLTKGVWFSGNVNGIGGCIEAVGLVVGRGGS